MNVILLVVDAMRYDMPWEGYDRPIAPNLSKLYDKSIAYERGYAISSFTSKSMGGALSGRYPSSLKRTTPFFTDYKDENVFMAGAILACHDWVREKSGAGISVATGHAAVESVLAHREEVRNKGGKV